MRCPKCGTPDDRVVDSRDLDDAATIRRRRECSACHTRFTTYERVESARLAVLKSDGSREEFDRDKLAAGLAKALTRRPVGRDAAEEAADAIETKLRSRGLNEVDSSIVGEMAMERLRELDQIAYIRFMSVYQIVRRPRAAQERGRCALRRADGAHARPDHPATRRDAGRTPIGIGHPRPPAHPAAAAPTPPTPPPRHSRLVP